MRTAAFITALSITGVAGLGMAAPAAAEGYEGWGPAHIEIPGVIDTLVTSSVPFTVTSPTPICDVWSTPNDVTKTGEGQYSLTVNQEYLDAGVTNARVNVEDCNGEWSTRSISLVSPLVANITDQISPWGESSQDRIAVSAKTSDGQPALIEILRDGKVVKREAATNQTEYRVPTKQARDAWQVRVTDSAGHSIIRDVRVAYKWAPMNRDSLGTFPQCSTVKYFYDDSREPKKARGMIKDIRTALRAFEKSTGLTFVPTGDKESADLSIDWDHLGGAAGIGGYSSINGKKTGEVSFDISTSWVARPGFGRTNTSPNRGALILHEIGHALGLGHVDANDTIMSPISRPGDPTRLTKYDKAGLAALYRPASCGATSSA